MFGNHRQLRKSSAIANNPQPGQRLHVTRLPFQRKRNIVFCDRAVQGALLLHVVGHWVMFLFAAGVFLLFVEMLSGDPRDALEHMLRRNGPSILAVLVLAPIFLRDLCKLSNRFAGPIGRLQRAMRELAEGDNVEPVHFRDGDFWQDVAADFNRLAQHVHKLHTPLVSDDPHLSQPVPAEGAVVGSSECEPTEFRPAQT